MKYLITTAFCFANAITFGQPLKSIDSLVASMYESNNFSGTVLLAKNEKVIYNTTFGYSNQITGTSLQSNTLLNIASTGKIFTALAIAKLVEKGMIDINQPISRYVKTMKIPNADSITVKQLLLHTSGLGNYMTHTDFKAVLDTGTSFHSLLSLVEKTPLAFNIPGLKHQYSNSGYIILGKIIEDVTQQPFEKIIADLITKPAGMATLNYTNTANNYAKGHIRKSPDMPWEVIEKSPTISAPDGGVYTTAADLFKLDRALYSGKIVKPETLKMMQSNTVEASIPGLGKMLYGLGMMRFDHANGVYSWGHNGGMPGFTCEYHHYFLPNGEQYTVIILSNYDRVVRPLFFVIQNLIVENKL